MAKRKSPIAKNLANNSIAGMFSAIEIHNKPTIRYRYEIVVLLLLNSWELILKAYLYKFHKDIKLFSKDGTTKSFENCLNSVNHKIGKDFNPVHENLNVLYGYRNQVAHYYIEDIEPIVFSLVSKSIIFYAKFLLKNFKIDLSEETNLILLPIGFKRPISPTDYISNTSYNEKAPNEVKEFLKTVIDATQRLYDDKIDETIFVDFRMNLTNVNRTINADLIAGIDNANKNSLLISTKKPPSIVQLGSEGEKITVSRNKSETQGTLFYEELQEGIFNEINNVVDVNRLLIKDNSQFILGPTIYYRIYSERQHVTYNIELFELLAKTAMLDYYAPFLFWFTKLPAKNMVNILISVYEQSKNPKLQNLTKIILLLGDEAIKLYKKKLDHKYKGSVQKPDYYYSFMEQTKSKQTSQIHNALKSTKGKLLLTHRSGKSINYGDLIDDNNLSLKILSEECLTFFEDTNSTSRQKNIIRDLDYLAYGSQLINNEKIIEELLKRF